MTIPPPPLLKSMLLNFALLFLHIFVHVSLIHMDDLSPLTRITENHECSSMLFIPLPPCDPTLPPETGSALCS